MKYSKRQKDLMVNKRWGKIRFYGGVRGGSMVDSVPPRQKPMKEKGIRRWFDITKETFYEWWVLTK